MSTTYRFIFLFLHERNVTGPISVNVATYRVSNSIYLYSLIFKFCTTDNFRFNTIFKYFLRYMKITMEFSKESISSYPIRIYNLLTYMSVSRTHLERLPSGQIIISSTSGLPFLIYAIFHINSWCKGAFLLTLFSGVWNIEMEFFDKIAGLLWFLIFIEICIADALLMRQYPYFMILCAGFKLQNEIYYKLGPRAKEYKDRQDASAWKKVWFQWYSNKITGHSNYFLTKILFLITG